MDDKSTSLKITNKREIPIGDIYEFSNGVKILVEYNGDVDEKELIKFAKRENG